MQIKEKTEKIFFLPDEGIWILAVYYQWYFLVWQGGGGGVCVHSWYCRYLWTYSLLCNSLKEIKFLGISDQAPEVGK